MSHLLPYRPPAWPGLVPIAPQYTPASAAVADAVRAALGRRGSADALATGSAARIRGLRFEADGGERFFLKVVPASRAAEVLASESIARWVATRGASVIAAIDREPVLLPDGTLAIVYPFCDGRPPAAGDARALGAALAALHLALESHPDRPAWEAATAMRHRRLMATRGALARGELRAGPDPDRLAALAADERVSFLPEAFLDVGPVRPLHGDLNVFNMLIALHGVVFLDFEDVAHSVLPAAFDLAVLCERTILVAEPNDDAARGAVRLLLDAYTAAGGGPMVHPARLSDVLRGIALRSLCTLARIDPDGTDRPEWEKFFRLGDLALARWNVFP